MFAEVVVNRPTHHRPPAGSEPLRGDPSRLAAYTYRLPERLRDQAAVGHLVRVPLQASTALGIVVALSDEPPADLPAGSIRDVAEILDPLPVMTPTQIELARWIADGYLSPLNEAMRLMLPPDLEDRTFIVITQSRPTVPPAEGTPPSPPDLTPEETAALRLLFSQGGRLRLSAVVSQLQASDPEAVVDSLADKGLVEAHWSWCCPNRRPAGCSMCACWPARQPSPLHCLAWAAPRNKLMRCWRWPATPRPL